MVNTTSISRLREMAWNTNTHTRNHTTHTHTTHTQPPSQRIAHTPAPFIHRVSLALSKTVWSSSCASGQTMPLLFAVSLNHTHADKLQPPPTSDRTTALWFFVELVCGHLSELDDYFTCFAVPANIGRRLNNNTIIPVKRNRNPNRRLDKKTRQLDGVSELTLSPRLPRVFPHALHLQPVPSCCRANRHGLSPPSSPTRTVPISPPTACWMPIPDLRYAHTHR